MCRACTSNWAAQHCRPAGVLTPAATTRPADPRHSWDHGPRTSRDPLVNTMPTPRVSSWPSSLQEEGEVPSKSHIKRACSVG